MGTRVTRPSNDSISLRREPLVEHHVNDDSSDRHIHPERPGDTGDFFVRLPAFFTGAKQRRQDKGPDDHPENYVRGEGQEVDRAHNPLPLEFRYSRNRKVIGQIARKKNRRRDKCGDHAIAVSITLPAFNKNITEGQEYGRESVQTRVHHR